MSFQILTRPRLTSAGNVANEWPPRCNLRPIAKLVFAAIAAEESPEDSPRLAELAHFWALRLELKHKHGPCARCGTEGDVVHHEAATD